MLRIASRKQILIGLGLAVLMAVSRGHHFGALEHLPGASWAVFFLAGIYLRPLWLFPALMVEAIVLDIVAVGWGGVSAYCITPAYGLLIPAYASLWFAGRCHDRRNPRGGFGSLLSLGLHALAGAALCELFSSGGFYFLSGRFQDPNLGEFALCEVKYFPGYLSSLAFYVAAAALADTALRARESRRRVEAPVQSARIFWSAVATGTAFPRASRKRRAAGLRGSISHLALENGS